MIWYFLSLVGQLTILVSLIIFFSIVSFWVIGSMLGFFNLPHYSSDLSFPDPDDIDDDRAIMIREEAWEDFRSQKPVAYARINERGDLYDLRKQNNPYVDQKTVVPLYR